MNTPRQHYVIDTSVLAKYFLNEPESGIVQRLLESDVVLEAPVAIYAELLNTLKYAVSKPHDISEKYYLSSINLITSRIGIWDGTEHYPDFYSHISEYMVKYKKLTSYDALFISLAHCLKLPLLSEDSLHIQIYPNTLKITDLDL